MKDAQSQDTYSPLIQPTGVQIQHLHGQRLLNLHIRFSKTTSPRDERLKVDCGEILPAP